MNIIQSIFFGIVGAFIVIIVQAQFKEPPPRLAVVDLQSIILEKKKELVDASMGAGDVNKESIQQQAENFSKILEQVVKTSAKDNHLILMSKAAIFAGEPMDLTNAIKTRVDQEFKNSIQVSSLVNE